MKLIQLRKKSLFFKEINLIYKNYDNGFHKIYLFICYFINSTFNIYQSQTHQ